MPRGRKKQEKVSFEKQIEIVTKEIVETEKALKLLREKKRKIEKQIEEEKKDEIYRKVLTSGKNVDEILEILTQVE